jgi:hypothetical protein
MNETVQQGRIAWARLKKNGKNWDDWKTVGRALLEGRKTAMRTAGTTTPGGRGYSDAFNDWLAYNRFDLKQTQRAKLLVVMGILPEIERWRATLTPLQRARTNDPGSVLRRYRRAIGIKPEQECVSPNVLARPA